MAQTHNFLCKIGVIIAFWYSRIFQDIFIKDFIFGLELDEFFSFTFDQDKIPKKIFIELS